MPTREERREARREERQAELHRNEDDVVILVEEFTDNPTIPVGVKNNVLSQIRQLMEGVEITGFVDPGTLIKRPILALGGGSDSAESDPVMAQLKAAADSVGSTPQLMVEFLIGILEPLKGLSPDEVKARSAAMGDVANGDTKVNEHGKLLLVADLADANQKLGKLERQFGPIITALEPLTDAEKRSRQKGILLVANGDTEVDNLGKPVVTVPPDVADLQQQLDDAIAERNAANTAKNTATGDLTTANDAISTLEARIDKIKAAIHGKGKRRAIIVTDEVKAALEPPTPAPATP